jgi:hypothetical protein
MTVQFDQQVDAIYCKPDEFEIMESEEVHPVIILDFN